MLARREPADLPARGALRVLVWDRPRMTAELGDDRRVPGSDPLDLRGGQAVPLRRGVLIRDQDRRVRIGGGGGGLGRGGRGIGGAHERDGDRREREERDEAL